MIKYFPSDNSLIFDYIKSYKKYRMAHAVNLQRAYKDEFIMHKYLNNIIPQQSPPKSFDQAVT